MNSKTFTFDRLPETADELRALPEAALTDAYATAALTVAALCRYEASPDDCIAMLNVLKGPQELTVYEKQFLRDRLVGKSYVPLSYFAGTSPANDYTPSLPYTLTVHDDAYSEANEGYLRLDLHSSGADNDRQITLRRKGDQWFLWEQFLLPDIRKPAKDDPWA